RNTELIVSQQIKNTHQLELSIRNREYSPSVSAQVYRSNHLRWRNNFENTIRNDLSLAYIHRNWDMAVQIELSQFENYIYYNRNALPDQYTQAIQVYALRLKKNFDFGKFHLDNRITVQSSDNADIMPLPLLHTYNSFYFERAI